MPFSIPLNHHLEFGLDFIELGEKRIRGQLIEYVKQEDLGIIETDTTINRIEIILYFEKTITVIADDVN
jgi:hypothetical protein